MQLILPEWIAPVAPGPDVLTGHAIAVDGELIHALLPAQEALARFPDARRLELPGHLVVPGLVNLHTHAAMALMRGIADDVHLEDWLREHIWPREARFVTPDFVGDGVLLAAHEMLTGGITCCNDMYFYPEAAARAYQAAGMRAVLGLPVLDFPTPYASDGDAYLQAGLAARDAFKHAALLCWMIAPHAPYTVGDATFGKIVTFARQLDLPIQTHLQETRNELQTSLAEHGESPLARLDRLGATGPGFVAIHAVHLAPGDRERLATQGCSVVHCPTSNMKLASGIAPVVDLLAHGVNGALGTDGAASNNRLDLFSEMRLASLLAKVATGDAAALPAAEALRMATINGARALSLDDRIGSITPGKEADLIAVDIGELADAPVYDPVSHLVHVASRERVTDVWVRGERIVNDRRLTTVDITALAGRVGLWQQKLQ